MSRLTGPAVLGLWLCAAIAALLACAGCLERSGVASAPMTPAATPAAGASPSSCVSNCKAIAAAALAYAQDWDDALPNTADVEAFAAAISPYGQGLSPKCPETGSYYELNAGVGGQSAGWSANEILLKCSTPHPDGKIVVCLVSGTCRTVAPSDSFARQGDAR